MPLDAPVGQVSPLAEKKNHVDLSDAWQES
jgi:hypothetical protein